MTLRLAAVLGCLLVSACETDESPFLSPKAMCNELVPETDRWSVSCDGPIRVVGTYQKPTELDATVEPLAYTCTARLDADGNHVGDVRDAERLALLAYLVASRPIGENQSMERNVHEHLQILGSYMVDVVTGIEGMVDSVSFDAYGCVQASLRPRAKKDGTLTDGRWFDVKRLKPKGKRVMDAPFVPKPGCEIGAADKPNRT